MFFWLPTLSTNSCVILSYLYALLIHFILLSLLMRHSGLLTTNSQPPSLKDPSLEQCQSNSTKVGWMNSTIFPLVFMYGISTDYKVHELVQTSFENESYTSLQLYWQLDSLCMASSVDFFIWFQKIFQLLLMPCYCFTVIYCFFLR